MRTTRALLAVSLIVGLTVPALAAAGASGARKHRAKSSSKSHVKAASSRFQPRQRSIDDARATEIQQALIRAGYLTGSPSGRWDQASIAAMTKLQADNGWQTKLVPDSRALIKLGLGPAASASAPQATASIGAPASSAYAR